MHGAPTMRRAMIAVPEASGLRRARIIAYECDYFSLGAHATGAAGAMDVGFLVLCLIIIYDEPHVFYMKAAGSDIGRN